MAGGDAESWDPRLPSGGAVVDGRRAQVLQVATGRPQAAPPQARVIGDGPIGVIAADPGSLLQGLTDAGRTVLSVAEGLAAIDSLPPSAAIVGDVASWQARWDAVEIAATRAQLLLHGVTVATLRAVTGRRELPPPLPDGARWCWLLMPGRVVRARLP